MRLAQRVDPLGAVPPQQRPQPPPSSSPAAGRSVRARRGAAKTRRDGFRRALLVAAAIALVLFGYRLGDRGDGPPRPTPVPVEVSATVLAGPVGTPGDGGTPGSDGVDVGPTAGTNLASPAASLSAPASASASAARRQSPAPPPEVTGTRPAAAAPRAGTPQRATTQVASTARAPAWCTYAVTFNNRAVNGFTATLVVTNVSPGRWVGWTGTMTLVPAAPIRQTWGATFRGTGSEVTVTPDADRVTVNVGGTATMGFDSGSFGLTAQVTAFTVDGHSCARAT